MLPTVRTGQARLQIHLGDAAVQFQPSALLQRVPGVAYKILVEWMSPPGVSPWCLAISQALPGGWFSSLNANVGANSCRANLFLLL